MQLDRDGPFLFLKPDLQVHMKSLRVFALHVQKGKCWDGDHHIDSSSITGAQGQWFWSRVESLGCWLGNVALGEVAHRSDVCLSGWA